MRRAARVDATHSAIRTAFQRCGCRTLDTFTLGRGAPDMVCSFVSKATGQRITFSVEAKNGEMPASKQRLTEAQEDFHHDWHGLLYVVNSVADVPAIVIQAARDSCGACEYRP